MKESIKRHSKEWEINKRAWKEKAELREAYGEIYTKIKNCLDGEDILEIGSGLCKGKEWIPTLTTSDREPNPWIDRVESAYKINSPNESWDHITMLDVFHHLEHPKAALKEMHRVLRPNGSILIMEPDISLLGWLVYGIAHKEPVGYFNKISANPYPPEKEEYYACQSSAHRLFEKQERKEILEGFTIGHKERICMLKYVLTGGFSGPNILKNLPKKNIEWLEKYAGAFPSLASTRILIKLVKNPTND
jgi:SAM-dependent methyltransferase